LRIRPASHPLKSKRAIFFICEDQVFLRHLRSVYQRVLMPTIKNTRLVYSTDPDVEVEPRREKKKKSSRGKQGPKLPNDGVIRVFLERKGRKGKSVTVLRGLPGDASGKKSLLKQLKSKLGAGGSIKDGAIEIQGDHRDRVVAILEKLGYKAKKAGG